MLYKVVNTPIEHGLNSAVVATALGSASPGDCRGMLLQRIPHRIHKVSLHCCLVASPSLPTESPFGPPATMAALQGIFYPHHTKTVCDFH